MISQYAFKLPYQNKIGVIEGLSVILNSQEVLARNNDAIGIFFAEKNGVSINIRAEDDYGIIGNLEENPEFTEYIMSDVIPKDSMESFAILMFNLVTSDVVIEEIKPSLKDFALKTHEVIKRR